jgi:hypothetical protein
MRRRTLVALVTMLGVLGAVFSVRATYQAGEQSLFFFTHSSRRMNSNFHIIIAPVGQTTEALTSENPCDGTSTIAAPFDGVVRDMSFGGDCCPTQGTVVVNVGAATGGCPGAGSITSAVTCTATGSFCGCSDTTHTQAIRKGNRIGFEVTTTGSPNQGCGGINGKFILERR